MWYLDACSATPGAGAPSRREDTLQSHLRARNSRTSSVNWRDVATDQQIAGSTLTLKVDRDQASRYGLTMQVIDDTLYDDFGWRQIAQYFTQLASYHVIMEILPELQGEVDLLDKISLKSPTTNSRVPLSTFAKWTTVPVQPPSWAACRSRWERGRARKSASARLCDGGRPDREPGAHPLHDACHLSLSRRTVGPDQTLARVPVLRQRPSGQSPLTVPHCAATSCGKWRRIGQR